MYSFETNNFGIIEIFEEVDEFEKRIYINKDKNEYIDIYFKNNSGIFTEENIHALEKILNSYYTMKTNSENYIVENIMINQNINYYFEDLFAEKIGGPLFVYFMINNKNTNELDKITALPINEKIKYMPLPDLIIHYSDENEYDIKMVFNSVKDKYTTSLWFHYDYELILKKFWVDEIDPWK